MTTFKDQYGVEFGEALDALDEFMVVKDRGRVVFCIGFLATFYVRPRERPDLRERFINAYEKYRDGIGDKLVWGADPKTGTPKKLAGTNIADVRGWSRRVGPLDDFHFTFHGGEDKDDADPYSVRAFTTAETSHMSRISFTWPIGWVAERTLPEWKKCVVELANLVGPTHGYAGWGCIVHVFRPPAAAWRNVRTFASRFHGLEADKPLVHSVNLQRVDAIKGVNWLTLLGQHFVDRLGGKEQLAAALGPEIKLVPYDGGLIVQAGPRALLGDVNQGERMENYRTVARVLKPIRVAKLKHFDLVEFNDEATSRWLARFDDA